MKIFLSIIAALISGLIIGYVASKILVALSLDAFSSVFAIIMGMVGAVCAGSIANWAKKYTIGTICAFIIGGMSYYNFVYHNYLPIKRNPPENFPALVEIQKMKEPQGFFKYLTVAAGEEVETYGGRRRGMQMGPRIVGWVVEGVFVLGISYVGMTGWVDRED